MSQNVQMISFDIGIKNFAYCLFDVSVATNQITILDWRVLDISKRESSKEKEGDAANNNIRLCSCKVGQGKKEKACEKKAKYTKNGQYYCEGHAKKSGFLFLKKEFSYNSLKKKNLNELREFEKKYFPLENSIFLGEDFSKKILKEDKVQKIVGMLQNRCLESLEEVNASSNVDKNSSVATDLISIGRNLAAQIQSHIDLKNINIVLIENQISPIANKMKTIQGMLAQTFILSGCDQIEFISSANKLKGFVKTESVKPILEKLILVKPGEKPIMPNKENLSKNPNYKQHKKDGITYCRQWLQKDYFNHWSDFFERFPTKQDDLADSFLQGIWYLQHKIKMDLAI